MFGTVYLPDLESYWTVIETQTELLKNQQIMMDGLTQQINQLKIALSTISNSLTDKDAIEKESPTARKESSQRKVNLKRNTGNHQLIYIANGVRNLNPPRIIVGIVWVSATYVGVQIICWPNVL